MKRCLPWKDNWRLNTYKRDAISHLQTENMEDQQYQALSRRQHDENTLTLIAARVKMEKSFRRALWQCVCTFCSCTLTLDTVMTQCKANLVKDTGFGLGFVAVNCYLFIFLSSLSCSTGWPRIHYVAKDDLNYWSRLHLPSSGIIGVHHYTQFMWCLGLWTLHATETL